MDELEDEILTYQGWHFDKPFFHLDEKQIFPVVYDNSVEDNIPAGFNGITIPLDGTLRSSLEWTEARQRAKKLADSGILWHLDLGLFDRLLWPLPDTSQFQTLLLALHHFRDTLWKDFSHQSIGLCIYQGGLPNLAECNYLALLAAHMPDEIPVFAFIDLKSIPANLEIEQRLASLQARRVLCAVKGAAAPIRQFAWQQGSGWSGYIGQKPSKNLLKVEVALLIPESVSMLVEKCLSDWISAGKLFRLTTEETLLSDWMGLDELYVDMASLTPEGIRKVNGFKAAGGTVTALPC